MLTVLGGLAEFERELIRARGKFQNTAYATWRRRGSNLWKKGSKDGLPRRTKKRFENLLELPSRNGVRIIKVNGQLSLASRELPKEAASDRRFKRASC
jgi:hypothetical protein